MDERKKIVVTGATKGIGRAISMQFSREKFDLAICSRSFEELELFRSELQKIDNKIDILYDVCDVSDKNMLKGFADKIKKKWNRLDILVNNAGVFIPGKVHEEEEGALEKMIETNLYSTYHLTRYLLSLMMPHKSGHIFNICSIASIMAYENGGSYSVSKFAMHGLSKVLREEMKPHGVRVTSMLPGATLTNSWEGVDLPEERFMRAEDVASLVYDVYKINDRTNVEEVVLRPILGDI